MGRILDRYIFRELLVPFGFGVFVFTFVLLIARILKLVELVINRGVPPLQTLQLFSYILPGFLELTVPMALLLAILTALGRLSADSEITVLRASGVSLYQIARPIAVFTLLVYLAASALSVYARPWGNAALKNSLYEIAKSRATAGLKAQIFNDDFAGLVIYAEAIEPADNSLRRVLIADERDPEQRSTLFAHEGRLVPNETTRTLVLRLHDGSIHTLNHADGSYHQTEFAEYDLRLNLGVIADLREREKDPKEMTLTDLRTAITRKRTAGVGIANELVELHRKFSLPFACFVFGLIAVPLGIQPVRAVRSRGFAVSLTVIFLYYLFLTAGEALARRDLLNAAPALWLPNLVFAGIGAYLFRAVASERAFAPTERARASIASLRARLGVRFGYRT
jgi:lipopolysaccharide export system permease protein